MSRSLELLTSLAHDALSRANGLAHVGRFDDVGLTRVEVGRLRHAGVVKRARIGWYLDPRAPAAAERAVCTGGVLGCMSAAASYAIAVPPRRTWPTHVSLAVDQTRLRRADDPRRRAPAGSDRSVRLHWERRIDPPDGWRVSVLDALLQMAACVPFDWLVVAIDSARNGTYREPLLREAEVPRLRDALPEHLRRAVDLSDARAESAGETLIRLGLARRSIPFDLQVEIIGIYFADVQVDGWLPIESDGLANHSGEAVRRDRHRDATIASYGHPPLRFLQRDVEVDVEAVIDTIERVWRRGRPGS